MQPFISLTDLGTYLKRDLTDDDLAVIVLDAACETVRGYIGQDVNLNLEGFATLNGSGTESLLLPQMPVIGVASVTEDGVELAEGDEWLLDRDGRSGILRRLPLHVVWPLGYGNVEVEYAHGWAAEEADVDEESGVYRVPSDLRRVALAVAQRFYANAGTRGPVKQETMGSYSYTLAGDAEADLEKTERRVLDRYRRRAG